MSYSGHGHDIDIKSKRLKVMAKPKDIIARENICLIYSIWTYNKHITTTYNVYIYLVLTLNYAKTCVIKPEINRRHLMYKL